MSDRATNEKLSNKMICEWREEIFIANLSPKHKTIVHGLHCMAHVLLGFMSYCKKRLDENQKSVEEEGEKFGRDASNEFRFFTREVAAFRIVRMMSELTGPIPDEKNGVRDKWEAYCLHAGVKSLIGNYKDNRFNAAFEVAAQVHYHRTHFKELLEIYLTTNKNKNVRSVRLDLNDDKLMVIVQALSIVYVKITGTYWDAVTYGQIHYLDLYKYIQPIYARLLLWKETPSQLLDPEEESLFAAFPSHKTSLLYRSAFEVPPQKKEDLAVSLGFILDGLLQTIDNQLPDFLPGGKYATKPTAEERDRIEEAQVTNMCCERFFGDLDSSMTLMEEMRQEKKLSRSSPPRKKRKK